MTLRRRTLRFGLASSLALGAVLGLVWAMVAREGAARSLELEFQAYRASSALVEAYAQDPDFSLVKDSPVLGFGLYGSRGAAIQRRGGAPESLEPEAFALPSFERSASGDSYVLIRPLGAAEAPWRGMMGPGMMGGQYGQGGMRGRGRLFSPPDPPAEGSAPGSAPGWPLPPEPQAGAAYGLVPGAAPDPAPIPGAAAAASTARAPRAIWLEYDKGGSDRERRILVAGASLVSLAVAGLYVLLLVLYRKNAELQEREGRNRELVQLGEAARTLAHEIKNPLAVIRIQTAALRRQIPPEAAQAAGRASLVIEEEVERLSLLSDRIRDFLKGGAGEPRLLDLRAYLGDFAVRFGSSIELEEPPEGSRVKADPERLSLALDNLVRNAAEADPEGRPRLAAERKGRHWEIVVADRGPGLPEELEPRLFEPFFSTKAKGSGIGLALAKRIAEGSGGALEYRRRPGGGALFVLSLPAL